MEIAGGGASSGTCASSCTVTVNIADSEAGKTGRVTVTRYWEIKVTAWSNTGWSAAHADGFCDTADGRNCYFTESRSHSVPLNVTARGQVWLGM